MSATNGFSPENLLGKGGSGPVFKVSAVPHRFGVTDLTVLEVVGDRKNNSHFEFDCPLNLVGYVSIVCRHGSYGLVILLQKKKEI
ncbi:hypothetical protein V6N13_092473 [Hibiscus sabdariffa]